MLRVLRPWSKGTLGGVVWINRRMFDRTYEDYATGYSLDLEKRVVSSWYRVEGAHGGVDTLEDPSAVRKYLDTKLRELGYYLL